MKISESTVIHNIGSEIKVGKHLGQIFQAHVQTCLHIDGIA